MNNVIRKDVKNALVSVVKELEDLITRDGKCPDAATLILWAKGKSMAWDITVTDTFAESCLSFTASEQGAAAKQAADNKIVKYQELKHTHTHLFPGCY